MQVNQVDPSNDYLSKFKASGINPFAYFCVAIVSIVGYEFFPFFAITCIFGLSSYSFYLFLHKRYNTSKDNLTETGISIFNCLVLIAKVGDSFSTNTSTMQNFINNNIFYLLGLLISFLIFLKTFIENSSPFKETFIIKNIINFFTKFAQFWVFYFVLDKITSIFKSEWMVPVNIIGAIGGLKIFSIFKKDSNQEDKQGDKQGDEEDNQGDEEDKQGDKQGDEEEDNQGDEEDKQGDENDIE